MSNYNICHLNLRQNNEYIITVAMKVETDIIVSKVASPILVIMYVEAFKIDVIVFIGYVILYLTLLWPVILQYQSQSVDMDHIPLSEIKRFIK
jgi:hypothetical protein